MNRPLIGRPTIGRPSIANVIVTVALVTLFSAGSATAALVVRSADIVDGQVKTADLANGAVTTNKLAANAVTGAKIDESTLGIVPNADTLDGQDSTSFVTGPGRVITGRNQYSHGDGVYVFQYNVGLLAGFNIVAQCSTDRIFFLNNGSAPLDIWYRHNGGDAIYAQVAPQAQYIATEADGPHLVNVHIIQPGTDRQALLDYAVREIAPTAEDPWGACFVHGTAVLSY